MRRRLRGSIEVRSPAAEPVGGDDRAGREQIQRRIAVAEAGDLIRHRRQICATEGQRPNVAVVDGTDRDCVLNACRCFHRRC